MLKILKSNQMTRVPSQQISHKSCEKFKLQEKQHWGQTVLSRFPSGQSGYDNDTSRWFSTKPTGPLRRDEVIQIKEKFYRFFTKYYLVWSVTEKANCEATTLFCMKIHIWFYMDSLVFRPLNQSYSLLKKQLNYLCLREPSCSRTVSTGTVPDPPGWSFHVLPMCVSGFLPDLVSYHSSYSLEFSVFLP